MSLKREIRKFKDLVLECVDLVKDRQAASVPEFLKYHKRNKLWSQEFINYKFKTCNQEFKDSFLPFRMAERYWKILNPWNYAVLARDKFIAHSLLERLNIPTPRLLAVYSPEFGASSFSDSAHQSITARNFNEILSLLDGHNADFIMKPAADSAHGDGVRKLNITELKTLAASNQLDKIIGDKMMLFEEAIIQNKQMASFNESSVNTIRMMTALYPSGEVKLFAAFLKIGRKGSTIDNAGAGGNVDCGVNVETGELFNAVKFDSFDKVTPIECHPDSGHQINGVKIENWDEVVRLVKMYQARIPWLKTIGWDVALTENGPVIIEINNWWDTTGQLFIGRGWHEDVKECYNAWREYHSIIRR